ncbi:MAG: hypothetical protein AB7K04_16580, partial [Pseudorhodoplanes sp.]
MWSRQFLRFGVGTSFVVASIAVALIWLVMRLAFALTLPSGIADYGVLCLIGIFVYPPLWALLVHMRQSYSRAMTYVLIAGTYLVSCAIVFAIMHMIGTSIAHDMARAPAGANIHAFDLTLHPAVAYGRLALGGAVLFLPPFAAIAAPLAFMHRRLLLGSFAPQASERIVVAPPLSKRLPAALSS